MIEAVADFGQVQPEVSLGYAAVGTEPVFGIASEPFHAVDMSAPDRLALFLADQYVIAT